MAPIIISSDSCSAPLVDYFFITGIEASQIYDSTTNDNPISPTSPTTNVHQQRADYFEPTSPTSIHSPTYFNKRSRLSFVENFECSNNTFERKSVRGNRDSAGIHGVQENEAVTSPLSEMNFDEALRKFISDRDTFLEDIKNDSANLNNRNSSRPKTMIHRLSGQGHKRESSNAGSIRKRLSAINPLSRQSTVARQPSNRLSRHISPQDVCTSAPQRFRPQKHMHPLKRSYEPVLLDSYPGQAYKDNSKTRSTFPPHVPMFAFPNDINVVSADERPRATWHGFAMTNSDGSKLYGMSLIIWIPLQADAAQELELHCEKWRNANMSNEERDMAKDLGSRLAIERARLSELLTLLPSLTSGSEEREQLEEEISKVEEKIALMTDALRPVRHAAASKIDGLTDGATGFWIPRAYGVLGQDQAYAGFWKEWLRAITVPMMGGGVLRVPASSPRVGIWQPLERYVVNLCTEAPSPVSSITQVELSVRELRLYARKEAVNEIPGSRTTDLYPVFRCLDILDIVTIMEYVLMESRIIFLSSHTSMLYLATSAILQVMWPLKWTGAYIPVLPARLIQALDAPCPYIMGIERSCERVELPTDDYVLVDLDQGTVEATCPSKPFPQQHKNKLLSLLQLAAPHYGRFRVPRSPPKYATEAFPSDAFCTENGTVFEQNPPKSTLCQLATVDSATFGTASTSKQTPRFNALIQPQAMTKQPSNDRLQTSTAVCQSIPPSPSQVSVAGSVLGSFTPRLTRHDSASTLQTTMREKRSGGFMFPSMKRNSTMMVVPQEKSRLSIANELDRPFAAARRPSPAFSNHSYAQSVSTTGDTNGNGSTYSPSIYAYSTMAPSTIMPNTPSSQSTTDPSNVTWAEGHCLEVQANVEHVPCSVCNEKGEGDMLKCNGCNTYAHGHCTEHIHLVCPAAFNPDKIIAAFARFFAGLLHPYRKFLTPASTEGKKSGLIYRFNMDAFVSSVPHAHGEYLAALRETQSFTSLIDTICTTAPTSSPEIQLLDDLITLKRNRSLAQSTSNFFSKQTSHLQGHFSSNRFGHGRKSSTSTVQGYGQGQTQMPGFSFLADTSDHIWRTAAVPAPNPGSRNVSATSTVSMASFSQNTPLVSPGAATPTSAVIGVSGVSGSGNDTAYGRVPAKLDPVLLGEPRVVHGVPRLEFAGKRVRRKEVPTPLIGVGGAGSAGAAGRSAAGTPAAGNASGKVLAVRRDGGNIGTPGPIMGSGNDGVVGLGLKLVGKPRIVQVGQHGHGKENGRAEESLKTVRPC